MARTNPKNAAVRRRNAHRSPGIRAQREVAPAKRAPRTPPRIPTTTLPGSDYALSGLSVSRNVDSLRSPRTRAHPWSSFRSRSRPRSARRPRTRRFVSASRPRSPRTPDSRIHTSVLAHRIYPSPRTSSLAAPRSRARPSSRRVRSRRTPRAHHPRPRLAPSCVVPRAPSPPFASSIASSIAREVYRSPRRRTRSLVRPCRVHALEGVRPASVSPSIRASLDLSARVRRARER